MKRLRYLPFKSSRSNQAPRQPADLLKPSNEAVGQLRNLWIAFILLGSYLLFQVIGTTETNLLLNSLEQIPTISATIPIDIYYTIAPAIFAIFHIYILLQLYIVSIQLQKLKASPPADGLDSFFLAQLIAGDPTRTAFRLVAYILAWGSLVVAPVGLLLLFQIRFVPFHSNVITAVQRLVIGTDLIALCLFWSAAFDSQSRASACARTLVGRIMLTATAFVLVVSVCAVTVPGSWTEATLGNAWMAHRIFDDYVDKETGKTSLFTRNLVVFDKDVVDVAKTSTVRRSLDLRGRELRGAILDRDLLRKADFTNADLSGASLQHADLTEAILSRARLQGANLRMASLVQVHGDYARFEGSYLGGADLQKSFFNEADFKCATLSGANIYDTSLNGAHFNYAQLQGAQVVFLHREFTRGIDLQGSVFEGANFKNVLLEPDAWKTIDYRGAIWSKLDSASQVGGAEKNATPDSLDEPAEWKKPASKQNDQQNTTVRMLPCQDKRYLYLSIPPDAQTLPSFEYLRDKFLERVCPVGSDHQYTMAALDNLSQVKVNCADKLWTFLSGETCLDIDGKTGEPTARCIEY